MDADRAKKAWQDVVSHQKWETFSNAEMGPNTTHQYMNDPRHLCFVLSRYKFCAKLLTGKSRVLEVGCGDAFGTPLVAQTVGNVLGIDWDAQMIQGDLQRLSFMDNCTFQQHDVVASPLKEQFDGAYSVDVIEHIDPIMEAAFMQHCCASLSDDGIFIVGTPNVKAEEYALPPSKLGHINLKDAAGLEELLSQFLKTVFIFSMNDEVVHTGFHPMAHYLFGVGIGVKR